MDLEQLISNRNELLIRIKAFKELQAALEYVNNYNRENISGDEVKIVSTVYDPYFEDLDVYNVSEKIRKMYDELVSIFSKIEQLKAEAYSLNRINEEV